MGAQACMTSAVPGSNTTRDIGSIVSLSFQIKNCGNTSGNFHMFIRKNGAICDREENFVLAVNGYSDVLYCEFTMPSSDVTVRYTGGHSEGAIWIEDYEREITISPAVTVCDQPVTVVDEGGVKIDNARVDCYEGANFKAHCTTYYGKCLISFLDIGTLYRVKASKTGYDCLNCEKTFIACTSTTYPGITLTLKKKPITCNQSFIVKDTAGNTIYSNCIIVVREGGAWKNECATSTSGTCTVGLIQGSYLRACIEQVPSGYELISGSCKNFTACSSRITLTLKKSCTCGSWVKGDCISETHRRYTRTCTPSGCDVELEDRPDPTCTITITCDGATPNFDTGCALLLHFDIDNDGIISATDRDNAWEAESIELITHKEAQFVEDAYNAGSINALCPGCYAVPSLIISPTTHSSPAAGDSFTISVTSNIAWTVSDDSPWIHYSPPSGSGNGTIAIKVDENTGAGARTGNVFATGEGITRKCTITQAGAAPLTCNQPVKVKDKDTGAGIGNVTVAARPTTGTIIRCTTNSVGQCTLVDLIEGDSYGLVVESYPEDYECQYTVDCEESITACTTERTFRLKKKLLTCEQLIRVEDTTGVLIDASVTVSGATCSHYATGKYKITLTKGDSLIAKATKSGYKDATHSFTACEPEFTLTLEEIVAPYMITITVNDQDGNPIEGAYVANLKQISELFWEDIDCHDVAVSVLAGECTIGEFMGRNNLLKTNSSGIVKIGLDTLPGASMRYGFHAGRPGYLNESYHEDWSEKFETTRRQGENGEGEYNFMFTLTKITELDKFIVHTVGLKVGDVVEGQRAYAWSKCFITVPFSSPVFKAPDAYPDGTVEFTTADGLKEGETYGIGPRIAGAILPMGPVWCGAFGGIREITMPRYGAFGFACSLMGMDPAGDECRRFWAEMLDPIYCANCITGVFTGKDVHGAEYQPGKFELAMFPVVVVCSFIPWLPGAKITKSLGRLFKKASRYGDNLADVRKYYEDDYLDIYRIQVYGDDVRLEKWAKALDEGNVAEARRIQADIIAHPAAGMTDAKAVDNFNSWLDELEKQIDNIDPKQVDEIADLRIRVSKAADACMDDVTDFTRVYDEKYIELIDVTRRGSRDTAVSTFVRAADKTCSPMPWHCKFSFVNALGEVTVGAEKVNLGDVTAVLHTHGLLDETKYVYKNIIKAFAHADESQIRALRLALEADNYDEVIRLLNDLPRVDMEGRLIARFFNDLRIKSLDKWADRADGILMESRLLDEEIDEIAGIAENHILWYRFAKTADTRENLFINMLRNASRGPEVISPAGRSAFTSLSFNNGEGILESLRRISDKDYMNLSRKLGPATEEGKLLEKLKRLQVCIDDGSLTIPAGTDVDTWVRIEIRNTISGISPSQYGGPWPELANRLTGEFPTMTPDRVVAECSMLTDNFKAAEGGVQWGRVRAAGVSKLKSEGYTTREAELLIDGKISLYMKELTKKPFTWAIDHPLKAAGAVLGSIGIAYGYVTFGFWIVWYYEELPQMTSMPMYMAVKNENWLLAAEIWTANRATINGLESSAAMVKRIWPLWADWLDRCLDAHKAANEAYLYMIDPSAPMPKLPEGMNGHVMDVIDSDTIWSGMPDSKLEEMIALTKAHDPQENDPKADVFIPPTLTIRFAGVNGPDKGDVGGYWIHRIATIGGEPEIAETTGDCYTNANTDTYTKLSRKDIFILSDESNQWGTFRMGKICRFIAVIRHGAPYKYASEELLRSGWGKVYFHDANKQVGISKYLTIETAAKNTKLGLWSPACIPCPATDVWFDYNPPPRVGVETIFYGWVSGCELSEITGWKWVFPGGVTKEGRIVKHTFTAEWKGPIRLEICAGALTESREVTVKKAYPNKASPCSPYGDVNDDGYVNDLDGKLVSDYVDLGWDAVKEDVEGLTEAQFIDRADVSKSGEVDISDVNLIYAYHAGETKKPHFPVCPDAPPSVKNVKISATPDSPVDVGTTVTFVGTAEIEAPYVIDSWTWKITDPAGTETTKSGKTITHLFGVVGTWSVVLKACNNVVPANCSSTTKTMRVEEVIPPEPKGNLTIKTYATRDFATADPLAVETFYIDGATVAGTYSCTKSNLLVSENPHMVKIDFKEAPHTCYVDTLDECFDTCEFGIDVIADMTTVVQVCPARSCIFTSNYSATISVKPEGTPDSEYKEVSGAHLMPLGTYVVKFVNPGYSTIVGYITVGNSGIVCENISIPPTGVCYSTLPPEPVTIPGIYVSGFVVKGLLKALPTKTVTFDSGPVGAVVTVD